MASEAMMAEEMKKMAEQKKKKEEKEAEKKKKKKEAKEAMMAEKEKKKEAKEALKTVLLPVQEHLLIKSDTNKTGFKGVKSNHGRFQAQCSTSPCLDTHLGMFGTPQEAAQAYLQHRLQAHVCQ